ncbi:MAG: hypothetical protein IT204_05895 [Fimbriimonadaceae bacterium]|nr:hypothetical protein [Fimbriimonadaceae bacterium]
MPRITLEDLRLYFSDRHGDTVSALGVAGLAGALMLLAQLTQNEILALVSFVNFAFLWVPVGSLWQRRRLRERWQEVGLDAELLRYSEALTRVDWSLDEQVDSVLGVYTTMVDLSRHSAWYQYPRQIDEQLQVVREALLAFFQRVLKVDELRKLYDRCAESMRQPGRLAAMQARVDREYKQLEGFADAFERALLDYSEALAAALGTADDPRLTSQLDEFAAGMRRLAQNIDESSDATELFEELTEEATFDRLLAAHDALAAEQDRPQSVATSSERREGDLLL